MVQEKINWTGKSGTQYLYSIYPKGTTFNEIEGNYIFAKLTTKGWDAVYIGEGNLKTRTQDENHVKCAERKGFTHYHVHANPDAAKRKAEETDLILGNTECFIDKGGCNKTITG